MRVRAAAVTATVGAATTWLAVPLVSLALGRSLDERSRARVRAAAPASGAIPAPTGVVVPLRRTPTAWAAIPAPRSVADDARRVSEVG
jgi:hypothetical protein